MVTAVLTPQPQGTLVKGLLWSHLGKAGRGERARAGAGVKVEEGGRRSVASTVDRPYTALIVL